jgi:deoxyribodipyrimidine photo-lyase
MSSIVWFRNDLRSDDNAALNAACAAGGPVTALYLLAPQQWQAHDWGARKQAFAWGHVLALRETLAARGIPLHVLLSSGFADADRSVAAFARQQGAAAVSANAEYGIDEVRRDARVARTLRAQDCGWRLLHDFTLLPPGSVRTGSGTPYKVFTPFRRAWLQQVRGEQLECLGAPLARAPIQAPPLPSWQPPACSLDSAWWPIGEAAAHARLADFIDNGITRYDTDRDVPALDGTSRLSPYLAIGAISVRRCMQAALACNQGEWDSGNRGVQTWLSELIWREFYTHVLSDFPEVSRNRPFRPDTERVAWREPGEDFLRWSEARSGFPLVDAAMRQLLQTGWMHNRMRMVTAMFLSKYLLIDWRHGERFFMQQLIDGELGANNGGWQWSASTGTDAAPYFRLLSPLRQAERFDPDGSYTQCYLPELAGLPAKTLLKPGDALLLARGYPPPMVDLGLARERVLGAFRAIAAGEPGLAPEPA